MGAEPFRAVAEVRPLSPWWLLVAGLAAMYLPVYWAASQTLWQSEEMGHGPIILGLVLWLFWRARERIAAESTPPFHALGWPLFAFGVVLYAFGRTFSVASIEFISQIFVLAGGLALLGGRGGLKAAWFPLLYLLFLVPLPASVIDAITGSLKNWVSVLVVDLLYALGYPIARTGVMISIGPYQLLVADACSGLNSMFSLTAIGALFIYFKHRAQTLHNVLMVSAILPIAFVANIVRVTILSLITYHFGDEAGAGFLHSAAGFVLMAVAVGLLFALDAVLMTWREKAASAT
ncbi:exosortase B [Piscinibacter gummiphilus]|uniref:Exosortase B n=1 Tax=Piscinibacter gummiphilus TaxID=946333 RepID=A0ABZ0CQQ2_9BURK|nr:exosortase B [Piscinibacter gummiphilus]WOB07309.1 exosortase B [Piscinibacter gummiphilus]